MITTTEPTTGNPDAADPSAANPSATDPTAAGPRHLVALNDEEQYSVWPEHKDLPAGWRAEGASGTRDECLARIEVVWTDGHATEVPTRPHGRLTMESVLDRFHRHAATRPSAPAVIGEDGSALDYRATAEAALRLADALALVGVGPGTAVAVGTGRAPLAVVAMLACWLRRAVYVPVDPAQPEERLRHLLDDSGARLVITSGATTAALAGLGARTFTADECVRAGGRAGSSAVYGGLRPTPDDTAYLIYTSGSTGTAKGVAVPHRALANVVDELARRMDGGPGRRWAGMAPFTFDISMAELCVPLATGSSILIPVEATLRDAAACAALLTRARIDRMQAVPSQWRTLLDAGYQGPDTPS